MSVGNSGVLVTGGAGYIGSHIVLALLARGERVVAVDNLSTGFRKLLFPDVEFVHGDYGDRALLDKIFVSRKVDAVIHAGASIRVPESVSCPAQYYDNNVVKTLELIRVCLQNSVHKFIFSSSAAVYNATDAGGLSESMTTAPLSPYGASKMMSERMLCDVCAATPLCCVALRYFNVAGADPELRAGDAKKDGGGLFKSVLQCATGVRTRVEICGVDYPTPDGTALRDYIHVRDVADANLAALDYVNRENQYAVFNLGSGRATSVREVVSAVERASGRAIETAESQRRPGDVACSVSDPQSMRRVLGFVPKHSDLNRIAADALAWERSL